MRTTIHNNAQILVQNTGRIQPPFNRMHDGTSSGDESTSPEMHHTPSPDCDSKGVNSLVGYSP